MIFKTMKTEDIRKALEGHKDILKTAFDAIEQLFRTITCPACQGDVMAVVNAKVPFKEGSVVPNYLAKCKSCSIEFDPFTGIIVTL